jgi:hypothetical protein
MSVLGSKDGGAISAPADAQLGLRDGTQQQALTSRYCEEKFISKYIPTIGIDYGVKPVKLGEHEVGCCCCCLGCPALHPTSTYVSQPALQTMHMELQFPAEPLAQQSASLWQ